MILNDVAQLVLEQMRGAHPGGCSRGRTARDSGIASATSETPGGFRRGVGPRAATRRSLRRRHPWASNTCGRRLRAAGLSFEDRHDLLGHRCELNSVISRIPTSPCGWGRLDKSYARASLFLPNTDRIADCPVAYVTLIRRGRMVKSPTHSQFQAIRGRPRVPAGRRRARSARRSSE